MDFTIRSQKILFKTTFRGYWLIDSHFTHDQVCTHQNQATEQLAEQCYSIFQFQFCFFTRC